EEISKENLRREAEARVRKADEERRKEMERARALAEQQAAQHAAEQAARADMNVTRRMTAEEVRAAREAAKRQMSGNPAPQPEVQNPNNVIFDSDAHQFDTTKLDISKIMGMNDDLTKTFEMLDSLEDDSSNKKGGKR
ncbi:MAG: hypothetical protein J6D38_07155, partial [Solobacterium sp.]|nr:hypothetical protein [Solobacterium sp.]